jgi:hypothetical protein
VQQRRNRPFFTASSNPIQTGTAVVALTRSSKKLVAGAPIRRKNEAMRR